MAKTISEGLRGKFPPSLIIRTKRDQAWFLLNQHSQVHDYVVALEDRIKELEHENKDLKEHLDSLIRGNGEGMGR